MRWNVSWRRLRGRPTNSQWPAPRRPCLRLALEALEDRSLPSFLAPVNVAVADTGAVLSGDFNGDGKVDLAAVERNTVSVLLGNGNGTFQSARNTTTGA